MKAIGVRLVRGILCAALAGGIGWIALQLPVGMLLTRNFTQPVQIVLERVWLAGCVMIGLIAGILFDRRWLNEQFRWICWGAVTSLTALLLWEICLERLLPRRLMEPAHIQILGRNFRVDEVAFVSAPGALFVGGFLGGFLHRRFRRVEPELAEEISPSTTMD